MDRRDPSQIPGIYRNEGPEMSITAIIGWALKLLSYFLDPEVRKKNRKDKIYTELKDLEDRIGLALAEGDPMKAAALDKRLRELRQKIRYVEAVE